MRHQNRGFSLIELLIAMAVTLITGVVVFQLFQQNEKIFRDQQLVIEMQQTARAVITQISDEIRMAGQGVPVYASTFDNSPSEDTTVILNGSTGTRLNMRVGLYNAETAVANAPPLTFTLNDSRTLAAVDARLFSDAIGTGNPSGRYVFLSGPSRGSMWAWLRAELSVIDASAGTVTLKPAEGGSAGRRPGADGLTRTADDSITFERAPTISLEEAVAFYFDRGSIRRAIAAKMDDPAMPAWNAGQEVGRQVSLLVFRYYDEDGGALTPDTLADRARVVRIDVQVVVETSDALSSTGSRQNYALSTSTVLRNARIRQLTW